MMTRVCGGIIEQQISALAGLDDIPPAPPHRRWGSPMVSATRSAPDRSATSNRAADKSDATTVRAERRTTAVLSAERKVLAVVARDSNILVDRLHKLINARAISARALSRQAGLGDTYVNDLLSGKNSNPSIPAVQAIASALETSVAYLVGESGHHDSIATARAVAPMPLIGIVEAGAFRKLNSHSTFPMLERPLSHSYPDAKHFVLTVGDDSMGAAAKEGPILRGMEVLCVDMADAALQVESGRIYVIRRTLDGGQTYETIVRRAMVFRDRVELSAESGRPEDEKIVIAGQLGTELGTELGTGPGQQMVALGLVYGVFRAFE
jgi:transcriptional regulator with XRE-family HTH domain